MQVLSPLNQTYINNYQKGITPSISTPIEATKKDDKTLKLALAGLAIGGAAIALAAVGRYNKAHKLADKIEFQPARTIEEAREFAFKHLKVKGFELTDLASANHVNEALVNYNNNISKKHRTLVDYIFTTTTRADASVNFDPKRGRILRFNQDHFNAADRTIANRMQAGHPLFTGVGLDMFQFSDSQRALITKYSNPATRATMTSKEQQTFLDFIRAFDNQNRTKKMTIFSWAIKDPDLVRQLNEQGFPTTLDAYSRLDKQTRGRIFDFLKDKVGKKITIQDGGPFRVINHEVGHLKQIGDIGTRRLRQITYHSGSSSPEMVAQAARKFRAEVGKELELDIQSNISNYALTSPSEFVAEVYSYLCNGGTFSDGIMALYRRYNGPMPR